MHKAEECNLPKCYKFYKQTQGNKNGNNSNKQQKSGGKKGKHQKNYDKTKPDKESENKLQYTGGTNSVGIDTDYGDYWLLLPVVLYVYYWYSYWLNNLMNSDITLLLLIYYITLSAYNELLYKDYSTVLKKWWKKLHPQRRSRFLRASPSPGHRAEKRQTHGFAEHVPGLAAVNRGVNTITIIIIIIIIISIIYIN